MWVRQGRTDAWIAHKLDIGVDELARFKREHALAEGDEGSRARPADPLSVPPPEPRWEVFEEDDEEEEEPEAEEAEDREPARPRRSRRSRSRRPARARDEDDDAEVEYERPAATGLERQDDGGRDFDREGPDGREPEEGAPRRRRRGRRGGRRHRARRTAYEATFDHGGEGYGLWLDPAVAENPVYSEHWAGHRAVTVTVEPETITIRRATGPPASSGDSDSEPGEPAEDD
jgi:hypothetical protein